MAMKTTRTVRFLHFRYDRPSYQQRAIHVPHITDAAAADASTYTEEAKVEPDRRQSIVGKTRRRETAKTQDDKRNKSERLNKHI